MTDAAVEIRQRANYYSKVFGWYDVLQEMTISKLWKKDGLNYYESTKQTSYKDTFLLYAIQNAKNSI